jgi:hypothetical protein
MTVPMKTVFSVTWSDVKVLPRNRRPSPSDKVPKPAVPSLSVGS